MNYNPGMKEQVKIVLNTYKMVGLLETAKEVLLYLLRKKPHDDFDQKYGVLTSEVVKPAEAGIADDTARELAIAYVPTREVVMRHILQNVMKDVNVGEFSFVDLGCGKGRALIVASQFPFKEIIGVELSLPHCEVAQRNIEQYASNNSKILCRNIRVHCANAAKFDFPDSNLLIYMYRPFIGSIFHEVISKLCQFQAFTKRRVIVAYSCPVEEPLLEQSPGFIKRAEYQVIAVDDSWSLWECCGA